MSIIIADVRSYTSHGLFKGHGYAVASNYLQIFQGKAEVRVAGGPVYAERFRGHIVPLPYNVEEERPSWLNIFYMMRNMRKLFRVCCNDTIILQSSGVANIFAGLALFKRPETKVFMILYNTEALSSFLKRCLFYLAQKKIRGILCPNERVAAAYDLPSCIIPDYIYCPPSDTEPSLESVPYAEKKYDFCMVGLIWRDKGMVEAARCLASTPYKVLIAGEISDEEGLEAELRAVCDGATNIDLRIGYLSSEAYDAAIRQSRYGILNYSGAYSQHSSGVVFDFLFRGVPVIGKTCKTLQFIEEFHVGHTFDRLEEFDFRSIMSESAHREFCSHLKTYYEAHQIYGNKVQSFVLKEGADCKGEMKG